MKANEFLKRQLIQVRCVNVRCSGQRCFKWLGDMVHGVHTIQNFKCPDSRCGIEWLVEKDEADVMLFTKVPRNTKKNYVKDTGFRIEYHQEPVLVPENQTNAGAPA